MAGIRGRHLILILAALCAWGLRGTPPAASADEEQVSIHDIQFTADPSGASPYAGQTVQTAGVVTAVYREGFVIEEPAGGPWSGIYVYDPDHLPAVGDMVQLTARVDEYYGMTELADVSAYQVLSTAHALPLPAVATCASAATEPFEGVLVATGPVTVTSPALAFGEWLVEDASGALRIDDLSDLWHLPVAGEQLSFVQGILFYAFGDYKLEPRDDADLGAPAPAPFALHGTIATPDTHIPSGYVVIRGQLIEAVGETRPAGMPIIETGGIILPGLVNAHDHPQYNIFPALRFRRLFTNRYEWQASPEYGEFRQRVNALTGAGLACEMWKYAEARALLAGNTTQQGAFRSDYWDCYAEPRVLVRNPERMSRTIRDEIFPLTLGESARETVRVRVESGAYRSLLIHLSEGVDAESAEEFWTWQQWGLLPASVIIHGIPYGQAEFSAMREAGASLVWSPRSNLSLYGQTANPLAAMSQNVPVSLAPDWCPSGSYDILRELKVADQLNREQYAGQITDFDLVQMVTTNPATQLGLGDQLGRIAPGYLADLMVIEGDTANPLRALIDARAQNVRLVLIGGEALYGDAALLNAIPEQDVGEPIMVCGQSRRIRVALDAAGIPGSHQSLQEIIDRLSAVEPGILPLDPCRAYRQWLPAIYSSTMSN